MAPKLDVLVIGATGFTGRLTCRYLARKPELVGRWGIAGRSESKLTALKAELGVDVPSFVVDTGRQATVDAACAEAACVISCAGPFSQVGMPVVDACVRVGTHYVDSTGEVPFVRRAIAAYHEAAVAKGVVLVPCCGFDCVPSDVGNFVVHREAGESLKSVHAYVQAVLGGVSNGTLNSVAGVFENVSAENLSGVALVPKSGTQPARAPMRLGLWYENGRFTGIFPTASADENIVRRTNSLMGSSAVYVEATQGPFLEVVKSTLMTYALFMVMMIPPLRRWAMAKHFSGTSVGPSDAAMLRSNFRFDFVGETASGKRVETMLSAKEDTYTATGLFLGECALSALTLARKRTLKGGVLTPAYAFGDELVGRCRDAGLTIDTIVVGGAASVPKKTR